MLFAGRDQLSGLGAGTAETSRHHHFGRLDVDTRRRADGSVEDLLRPSAGIWLIRRHAVSSCFPLALVWHHESSTRWLHFLHSQRVQALLMTLSTCSLHQFFIFIGATSQTVGYIVCTASMW
jgi:hypothetical protein